MIIIMVYENDCLNLMKIITMLGTKAIKLTSFKNRSIVVYIFEKQNQRHRSTQPGNAVVLCRYGDINNFNLLIIKHTLYRHFSCNTVDVKVLYRGTMGNAVRQLLIRISIRVVSGYRGNRSPGYGLFPNGSVVKWKGKPT